MIEVLSQHGVLGVFIVTFSGVIVFLYKQYQENVKLIYADKNKQIAELKEENQALRHAMITTVQTCETAVRDNTYALEDNAKLLENVRQYLIQSLDKNLNA